ncbi:hypothetical protein [Pseudomonas syringae]|uniref:hypothetical protein n=1 Tax=Pseudomonas syringae TaxID=317 RepID=UPI0032D90DC5
MYKKIPETNHLGTLISGETLSRLTDSTLSKSSQERTGVGSFLTDVELQSLREEMIRDGGYMEEWLASKTRRNFS